MIATRLSMTSESAHLSLESTTSEAERNLMFHFLVHLQNSCRKIMTKKHSTKKLPVNDFARVAAEERFIKKLKEQRQGAEENRKTLHKCLYKLLRRDCRITHQLLGDVHDEVCCDYFVHFPLDTWTNEDFSVRSTSKTLTSLREYTISLATLARNR